MVAMDPTSSNVISMFSSATPKQFVMVATRGKYYSNVDPSNGQATSKPTSSTTPLSNHIPNSIPT